jgi:hypothetical protein
MIWKGGAEREGQRERIMESRGEVSGAGLGRREARRRGLGTAQVPNGKKAAEPLPVQPCECFGVQRLRMGTSDCGEIRINAGLG